MSVLIRLRDYRNLPAAEHEVQKFILKHPKEILDMTVYDVAEKTYTSPATVVRLCKRIGVKGFNKLKIELSSEVKSFDNLHLELLDSTSIQKEDSPKKIVDKITNIAIESIEETRLLLDLSSLNQAVTWISQSAIMDFYGVGASNIVAMDALYKFMRVGKTCA
ncbi:MAG: MurR/RpiR family transcriptional regulator, partial [Longicatena sp.]